LVVQDAVIPKGSLAQTLELIYREADAAGIPVVNVFHAGDGNLHPNFLFDSRIAGQLEKVEAISKRLMRWVVEVGGTLSGEHGIGNDKMAYMPLVFGADSLRMQLAVPAIFNADHQLNPLKVFAGRRFEHRAAAMPGVSRPATGPAEEIGGHTAGVESASVKPANGAANADNRRLFVPFFDTVDGVICVSADTTNGQLEAAVAGSRFRFPLVLDRGASLREQVAASPHAPAASRFGQWCDNLVGMNWRLPDGRTVRVGERVVKSTTGYDLMRFLLASGNRFGTPIDYVIRLRPAEPTYKTFWLDGDCDRLADAARRIILSDWTHWLDSIDAMAESGAGRLRMVANLPDDEFPLVSDWVGGIASEFGLVESADQGVHGPADGLPDLVLKTTADRVIGLAREIASTRDLASAQGVSCVASVVTGALHVYWHETRDGTNGGSVCRMVDELRRRYQDECFEAGGDWHSRHVPPDPLGPIESAWLATFISRAGVV